MIRYIKEALYIAVPAAVIFSCFWPYRKRALTAMGLRTNPWRETGMILFIMALFGILGVTLWPSYYVWTQGLNAIWGDILLLTERPSLTTNLNLVPFYVLGNFWQNVQKGPVMGFHAALNLVGNLIMFMPLGLFPALLWREASWKRSAVIGLGTSLFIEIAQYFLMSHTDIDDVILNTLGALCGYWLFLLLRKKCGSFTDRFQVHVLSGTDA